MFLSSLMMFCSGWSRRSHRVAPLSQNSSLFMTSWWRLTQRSRLELRSQRLNLGRWQKMPGVSVPSASPWPQAAGRSESESEVTQSCSTLCDPMDYSLSGSSIHGILQAGVLEWVAISFFSRSSRPRDRTWVSHIVGRHFIIWANREEVIGNQIRKMVSMFTLNINKYIKEGRAISVSGEHVEKTIRIHW